MDSINKLDKRFDLLLGATIPIYTREKGAPIPAASSILIKYRDSLILVSCSHVFRENKLYFVPSFDSEYYIKKESLLHLSDSNIEPGSEKDTFDTSILPIPQGDEFAFNEYRFLTLNDIYLLDKLVKSEYLIFGYPINSNEVDRKNKEAEAEALIYHIKSHDRKNIYSLAGLNKTYNIALKYNNREIRNNSSMAFVPKPFGISGSGLWIPIIDKGNIRYKLFGINVGGDLSYSLAYSTYFFDVIERIKKMKMTNCF
ncbi:hypothetical protein [Leptospira andrefontaineae]|uniref:Serine protease n=1 Tax=Leptospira andrefontaineae TaxID=2484976 RepID=A0A4R9H6M6_9LEPT|nr:hypothetical protein [Leptospira andrefontaineae]TGK41167.1 hypothetical protein EHO65_06970 [Leptospira andrefontaineae]